jgi:hypothetical protein
MRNSGFQTFQAPDLDQGGDSAVCGVTVQVPRGVLTSPVYDLDLGMMMGVLWFLHSKAMQAKARRLRQVEGQELQSMLGPREGQGGSRRQKHHQHPHHHPEVEVVDGTRENPPGDLNCNTTDCTVTPLI